jgi:hypothetical protein
MIFEENGRDIRRLNRRKIISIIDKEGNKRKSTFLKWLCYRRSYEIVKFGYGSSQQLRSAFVNTNPKPVYLINLSRTKGYTDRMDDLYSVIEEVKNGHIASSMYGKHREVTMHPPHIIVFSNNKLDYSALS